MTVGLRCSYKHSIYLEGEIEGEKIERGQRRKDRKGEQRKNSRTVLLVFFSVLMTLYNI